MTTKYFPDEWLESTIRVLKEYLQEEFHRSVSAESEYVGEQAYEVVPQFPGPDLDIRRMPMHRTIIHFEIDDIESSLIGFGDNVFDRTYDPATESITEREAQVHVINFDIGIWASDASGGTTSRSRAKQVLQNCLGGARGIVKMREWSDGDDGKLEILSYSGGRFMVDRINDMQVFRMVDSTLVIRVFSRTPLGDAQTGPAIEEIIQDPELKITDNSTLVEIE